VEAPAGFCDDAMLTVRLDQAKDIGWSAVDLDDPTDGPQRRRRGLS
jgi:hypothetical protein